MMSASIDRCFSFINSHTAASGHGRNGQQVRRAVTISRQTGCGAVIIAEKLSHYLQQHLPHDIIKWTVFGRKLMDKVLADHNLPNYLAQFFPEDRISYVEDMLAE